EDHDDSADLPGDRLAGRRCADDHLGRDLARTGLRGARGADAAPRPLDGHGAHDRRRPGRRRARLGAGSPRDRASGGGGRGGGLFRTGPAPPEAPAGPVLTAARNNLYADAFNEAVFEMPGKYLTRALVFLDNRGVDGVVKGLAAT